MKLIDKAAVVAEIERIKKEECPTYSYEGRCKLLWFEQFLSFLDTLGTKDMNSIWNNARKTIPEDCSNQIICIKEDDLAVATIGKLVHGTKKWAYLNDLLNISNVETKEVDLEKELDRYTTNNFWALDGNNESPYLVEKDDMLKVARHFYELGLRAKDVNEIIKTAEDHAYFAGSENTREKLIDKACKWWEDEFTYPAMTSDEIEYYKSKIEVFRKAMEE